MASRMKTTIHIPDGVLAEVRKLARRERTTLRALVEHALRQLLSERKRPKRFRLRDGGFGGKGLQPEFRDASWEKIRDAAYEGRGG